MTLIMVVFLIIYVFDFGFLLYENKLTVFCLVFMYVTCLLSKTSLSAKNLLFSGNIFIEWAAVVSLFLHVNGN